MKELITDWKIEYRLIANPMTGLTPEQEKEVNALEGEFLRRMENRLFFHFAYPPQPITALYPEPKYTSPGGIFTLIGKWA